MTDATHERTARRRDPTAARGGFTLLELTVALAILMLVLFGVFQLFQMSSRVARSQTQISELQQGLRVAQYSLVRTVRMAGRGGLPRGLLPTEGFALDRADGLAVAVRNNVPAAGDDQHYIAVGDSSSPGVVEGTDVLTVRGTFNTPLYQIDTSEGTFVLDDPDTPTSGTLRLKKLTPTGVAQDFQPLLDAIDAGRPEALIMVSPVDDGIYAVVELDPAGPNTGMIGEDVLGLDFKIRGGEHTDGYLTLSPNGTYPVELSSAAMLGILEEYRFFVREEHAIPGDDTSELTPRLTQARFYPATETAHDDEPLNLRSDLADNVVDLQVALGIDTDVDGVISDDGSKDDDWLFNSAADAPADEPTKWNGGGGTLPPLYYVRLSTLVRSDLRERDYLDPALLAVEDHPYDESAQPSEAERLARGYRRRLLASVVDLRNVS